MLLCRNPLRWRIFSLAIAYVMIWDFDIHNMPEFSLDNNFVLRNVESNRY